MLNELRAFHQLVSLTSLESQPECIHMLRACHRRRMNVRVSPSTGLSHVKNDQRVSRKDTR